MSNYQACSDIKISIPEVINEDNVTFYDICVEVKFCIVFVWSKPGIFSQNKLHVLLCLYVFED
jgi:hypothetical protein